MSHQLRQVYIRHGRGESRFITAERFAHKLNEFISRFGPVMFGSISVEPNALYQYGELRKIELHKNKAQWSFVFLHAETREEVTITVPLLGISLTHDIEYTIEDEQQGNVNYPAFFIKGAEKPRGPAVTYYIGAQDLVSNPLDCIAEFYLRALEIGKELKLSKRTACTVNPTSRSSDKI